MVEGAGTQSRPCPSCRRFRRAVRLGEGSHRTRAQGSRVCHAIHGLPPAVLALAIGVVLPPLHTPLVAAVDLTAPAPPPLRAASHAAVRMTAVARSADVEQPATHAVPAQALPQNDSTTDRAHCALVPVDTTPAVVGSFERLVARASHSGAPVHSKPRPRLRPGFLLRDAISGNGRAPSARMMTGQPQADTWSENCGFCCSFTAIDEVGYLSYDLPRRRSALQDSAEEPA